MLTYFQCELCHFRNIKGRDPTEGSNKDERLLIAVRQASLDAFCSRETGAVRGYLTMLRKIGKMSREEIGLEYWFRSLGAYPLKYEEVIGVACVTLRMSLRKGIYGGHLQ